jgi:tryptophan aminotransferase
LEKTPGLISLLAGKPNAATFPFESLTFKARSPINPDEVLELTVPDEDLKQGLQYSDTAGMKPLLDWLFGLQEYFHGRKREEGWRISVGSGSQDLIYKVCTKLVLSQLKHSSTTKHSHPFI